MQYIDTASTLLVDYREARGVEVDLWTLRSEIEDFKRAFELRTGRHHTPGLFIFKFNFFDRLVDDLERFGSMSSTDAADSVQSNVLAR